MQLTENIVKIQDLFDAWRQLGNLTLSNGIELIGRTNDDGGEVWLHCLFPGITHEQIAELETGVAAAFPPRLRGFYRRTGGLNIFHGAFSLYGRRAIGFRTGADALQPDDLLCLNHSLDALGWKPAGAIAIATNGWDQSVYLTGMGSSPEEIVRCERATGRKLEAHEDVFDCVSTRLNRLDAVLIG